MDLLLVFPPLSEATLFPYLSLPYLAGHVRRAGYSAGQADLNLELVHRLLDRPTLEDQARALHTASDLPSWYRAAAADVCARHLDEIKGFVREKAPSPVLGGVRAVRLARQAARLPLEKSALSRVWDDLRSLDRAMLHLAGLPKESLDFATRALYDLLEETLDRGAPQAVGLSLAFFSQLPPALLIAQWIRRLRPGTPICLGGQQVMLRHDELAAMESVRSSVDALCTTAGEEPLERWLAHLAGAAPRSDVPGMRWLTPSGATMPARPPALHFRDLGAPDYDGLKVRSYLNDIVVVSVVSCVGCYWGRCVFCSYGNRSLERGSYQQASPEQLASTIQSIVQTTGIDFVTVVDENTNLRLLVQAMRLVRDSGLRVRFNTRNRLEPVLLDPGFCRELADLGCEGMAVGYEGTSQRILDKLDKGVRALDFQRILDNLAAVDIQVNFSVMGGLLDETAEEAAESLGFLERNRGRFAIDVLELMVVEPGTRLAADPGLHGLVLGASGSLADNRELNYLGGRVGRPHAVPGGAGRPEALQRLRKVRHMGSAPQPPAAPRLPAERSAPTEPAVLFPQSWVRVVPKRLSPDTGSLLLADLVREQVYSLPDEHVVCDPEPGGPLIALSPHGRRLLDKLRIAEAGRI
ncbi:radical SAM protein [Streptomyces sp. NPDC002588]|uniref:B12-binding domain-containing radical SAM protein n=1 Tax=Streptomyces sp. NPDC002588 TaxID=3154419 RepID=UPI0033228BC3